MMGVFWGALGQVGGAWGGGEDGADFGYFWVGHAVTRLAGKGEA
jgi:hypothetical protein